MRMLGRGLVASVVFGALGTGLLGGCGAAAATGVRAPEPLPVGVDSLRRGPELTLPCAAPGATAAHTSSDSLTWHQADLDRPIEPRPRQPAPLYPRAEQAAGIDGDVVVRYVVGPDGRVEPCSVRLGYATSPAFGAAVQAVVLASRFTRPVRGGQPARVRIQQRMRFRS
jgi:TonB family protein